MQLELTDFTRLQTIIYDRLGISIGEAKRSQLGNKLRKLLKKYGMDHFKQYCDFIEKDESGNSLVELANCVTTNHTYFNRENDHFDFYSTTVLPEFTSNLDAKKRGKDLRVWCAGCSTGEEAYMLTTLLHEHFGARYKDWNAGVLATDISIRALQQAKLGVYSAERVEALPPILKKRYFQKVEAGWQAKEKVRADITFRQFNLMNKAYPFRSKFHIIFCRNVMIYFDRPTREAVVGNFHRNLVPGGYLFIGHSESIRDRAEFEFICPSVYKRR